MNRRGMDGNGAEPGTGGAGRDIRFEFETTTTMTLSYNTAVVLAGTALLGANAGLVGTFAVLRRRALTGDALAHATLPGICVAFLAVGERRLPALLAGAFVFGLLGVVTIAAIRRYSRIKEDAAVGLVLSVFFGLGVAMSGMIQNRSTTGSKAGLDSFILGKTAGMLAEDVVWIGGTAAFCLTAILALYKEFVLLSFDYDFARASGLPTVALDLAMMGLIALTVTIGLPAAGAVMISALLILPALTARVFSDRIGWTLTLAVAFGAGFGVFGTLLSDRYDAPAGPAIVLTGTAAFLASMGGARLLGSRRGRVVEGDGAGAGAVDGIGAPAIGGGGAS